MNILNPPVLYYCCLLTVDLFKFLGRGSVILIMSGFTSSILHFRRLSFPSNESVLVYCIIQPLMPSLVRLFVVFFPSSLTDESGSSALLSMLSLAILCSLPISMFPSE